MDFTKLKKLIKKNGDTFIFVEGGEPEMVLLSFAEYERLRNSDARGARQHNQGVPMAQIPQEDNSFLSVIDEDVYAAPYAESDSFPEGSAEPMAFTGYEGPGPAPVTDRFDNQNQNMPLRREDVRLEDLPI